jgi:virulence-associated protein VapD
MKFVIIPALLLSFAVVAQTPRPLPQIGAPAELSSGEYAEGTVTRMTAEDVAQFLPWAQNARNQLTRSLNQARNLPLRERPAHIERAVRAVVERSGGRQYQMFLRFALNRGMLLVDELERNVNMNEIGSQESALDLLQKAIEVGLEFYESDLAFQERAQSGETAIVLPYAQFGVAFMQKMYPGVVNVLDAGAQYRLLFKLIEMTNWDLSRDAQAARYAETIVETYEMTVDLPEQPSQDDRANMRMIRRLNGLKIVSPRPDQAAPVAVTTGPSVAVAEQPAAPRVAEQPRAEAPRLVAGQMAYDAVSDVVRVIQAITPHNVIFTDGYNRVRTSVFPLVNSRDDGVTVGENAYDSVSQVVRRVRYITSNGTVIFTDGYTRIAGHVHVLIQSRDGYSVGGQAYDSVSQVVRRVGFISASGDVIFTDGYNRPARTVFRLVQSLGDIRIRVNRNAYDAVSQVIRRVRFISSNGTVIFSDGYIRTIGNVQAIE